MTIYGLLIGGAFSGATHDFGDDTPADISHKNKEWRIVRVDPDPPFDPATERLGPPAADVQPTEIVFSRPVIALTADERQELVERARELQLGPRHIIKAIVALAFAVDAVANGQPVPPRAQNIIDAIKQAVTDNPDAA